MKKTIGWLLLFLGVALIVGTAYYSWQIFSAKITSPEIFQVPLEIVLKKAAGSEAEQMQEMVTQQIEKLLPADSLSKLLNLIAWSIGAAILILAGGKIAGLGIQLLKA